jgi:hypothetical protein
MINYTKQIIKLTSLNCDLVKGIVRLLGIEENAALTIWDATNELDCLLVKDVTDDIFFLLLIVESNSGMAPNDVYRGSEKEAINQGVLCTSYAHGLWYVLWPSKHTVEGLNEEWGVNATLYLQCFGSMRLLVRIFCCSTILMSWFIFIQGLGDISASDHILKLVKKHLSFDMNRKGLGKNITPTMLVMDDMLAPLNLEGMKAGFAFRIISLHAFIQWDLGELNFSMATTTNDYCWGDLFIFHGLLNFVFDRGKFLMNANFNLKDKVVFKEVGIDRNVIHDMGFGGNGPSPRVERRQKETKGIKESAVAENARGAWKWLYYIYDYYREKNH